MIVDASAVLAVFFRERGHEELLRKIADASSVAIGAPTAAEIGIVLTSRIDRDATPQLARFFQETRISLIPFTGSHWQRTIDAYARFGKGRHHASLSFGECLCYAVASLARQPLLCVGDDFRPTDLNLA